MNFIDKFLNAATMYKVVLYSLLIMAFFAVFFGFIGLLPYSGLSLLGTFFEFIFLCYFMNMLLAYLFKAAATAESSVITGLILFFIMPGDMPFWAVFFASLVAMASKYLIAWNRRHIFNPAAFAAVVFGFTNWPAVWWVANIYMLPLALAAGFLVVRKIRKSFLVFACFAGFVLSYFALHVLSDVVLSLKDVLVSWPIVFFATIMLTEPSTMPPKKNQQMIYGFIIGLFLGYPAQILSGLSSTPEILLCLGNIGSWLVSMKRKAILVFEEKIELAKDCYEFVFNPGKPLAFEAGQYMEWSLPHLKQDNRGIRRYFTVSSAPNQKDVRVGIRFAEKSSSFKQELMKFKKGDKLFAGSMAGDFILPRKKQKFVFIAGGIGITPFISMIRDLMEKNQRTDITMFYANKTNDIPYLDLLNQAKEKIGLKLVLVTGGFITKEMVQSETPDFNERMFYLSGPNAMVENYKNLIRNLGVSRTKIKTDYFPGF